MADTTLNESQAADKPKQSLVGMTLDGLIDIVIAAGTGGRIASQDELAKQFGVSRTVLREALVILVYLDVLTVRPKIGMRVNPPAQWKAVNGDVLEWRTRAGMPLPHESEVI